MTHTMLKCTTVAAVLAATCAALPLTATAAEWSDTALSYRYGTKFREPFNPLDFEKHIVNLCHACGYKYGKNLFCADVLLSD
jgi:hypothetical protein